MAENTIISLNFNKVFIILLLYYRLKKNMGYVKILLWIYLIYKP